MLKVIQEEQQLLLMYIILQTVEQRLVAGFLDPECLSDSDGDQAGGPDRLQRHECNPIGKGLLQLGCRCETQAGFVSANKSWVNLLDF
jgi:hypothetical protein